ncbi:golgin subfamily A member 6-like protein 22 [Camponotus floridanus]|uniref:golgin subfamily A member 6-like protein 22 n=1 Tax=Camponotus floridanus TaxID=104421 RepID=UPI000DC6851B|nr:golgin subfamily A member 6-like protein 22 [Camponotus floridanus]
MTEPVLESLTIMESLNQNPKTEDVTQVTEEGKVLDPPQVERVENVGVAIPTSLAKEEMLEWEARQLEGKTPTESQQEETSQAPSLMAISQDVATPPYETSEPIDDLKAPRMEEVPPMGTLEAMPSSVVTDPIGMDYEDANRAPKRKNRPQEIDSQEENGEEVMRPPKLRIRNRRVLRDDDQNGDSQEEPSQTIAPACGDGKNTAQGSASETDEEKRKKPGRPKKCKRAIDPEEAEKKIMEATGVAPEHIDENLLLSMTASDISAQALEYLEHLEVIRVKSGRLQGGLSGELKKRKTCLEEMVRALQFKAESKNDPEFLKHKLGELMNEIKKHKKEEEKRNREVSELRETINELRKENREMREELRRVREEVRRNSEERVVSRSEREGEGPPPRRVEESGTKWKMHSSRNSSVESRSRDESRSRSPSVVMRPPLRGKSVPIPEYLKQKKDKLDNLDRQIATLTKVRALMSRTEEDRGETVSDRAKEEESMPPPALPPPPLPQRKPRIRVVENIQLVPPNTSDGQIGEQDNLAKQQSTAGTENQEWIKVLRKEKRKEKRKRKGEALNQPVSGPPLPPSRKEEQEMRGKGRTSGMQEKAPKAPKRRIPRTAAVSIKGRSENFSYAEALRKARSSISLSELEIGTPNIRKGINGATIIEISGPENSEKADKLVAKLQEVLEDAVVTRPVIKGELRLIGLEESITKEEIEYAIAENGECGMQEVTVGAIRPTRTGLNNVWLRCPLKTAIAIANKGKIPIGWTIAKVELLQARPLQCYRCWRIGHTVRSCKVNVDYSDCCFRCGRKGHNARACQNPVRCVLCAKLKRESNHRVGSPQCEGVKIAVEQEDTTPVRRTEETQMETDNHHD